MGEDHAKFYEAVSRNAQPAMGMGMMMGPQPHMAHTHFKAEGDVEFKALLYVPSAPAGNFYEAGKRPRGLKLYVRRVFISDDFEELLPNYLGWVVGVVDSDTLPLSVSRETVQQSASLKTIRKKLVRKTIDMIKKLADKKASSKRFSRASSSSPNFTSSRATFWSLMSSNSVMWATTYSSTGVSK